MATEWVLLIRHTDQELAVNAADAVFRDIDALEAELSRFRPDSEVGRIGRLRSGESVALRLAAWDCLSLARDVWQATAGAFDVAIGPLYELWRNRPASDPPTDAELASAMARSGSRLFDLDEESQRIQVHTDHLRLDLGAIGKGYALDMAAHLLRTDWDVENALLITGGGSTVLAMGCAPDGDGWQINVGPPENPPLRLTAGSVSASGFIYQGRHIVNPRTGLPVSTEKLHTWAVAPTAALSDALSTAFLIMERSEIARFLTTQPDVRAFLVDGEVLPDVG